ncbi:hypothetical protein BJV77DRAFT_984923, partial [Russula vinacea]
LKEASRATEEDFERSGPDCEAADGFALIARSIARSIVVAAAPWCSSQSCLGDSSPMATRRP